jgi:hypothetical protein
LVNVFLYKCVVIHDLDLTTLKSSKENDLELTSEIFQIHSYFYVNASKYKCFTFNSLLIAINFFFYKIKSFKLKFLSQLAEPNTIDT